MKKILVIAGPTAVGKTQYSIELAKVLNGEIVSCDSMQLYKYMDIGSAKPTTCELSQVKHHLIGIIDPREPFSAAKYQQLAKQSIADIHKRDKLPIVTGGTGLYLNSLLYEMDFSVIPSQTVYRRELEAETSQELHRWLQEKDPNAAERIHPNNKKKLIRALEAVEINGEGIKPFEEVKNPVKEYIPILTCLNRDREELYNRINSRVDILIETGLVQGVMKLLDMGLTDDDISMKGIGYKEIIGYLHGQYNLMTAVDMIKQNTRRYAKRQLTWFRRYDKMKWFTLVEDDLERKAVEDITEWVCKNK